MLPIFVILIFSFFIFYNLRNFNYFVKAKNSLKINEWMSMSGRERNLYDARSKEITMERKKKLLTKIRKEYKSSIRKSIK